MNLKQLLFAQSVAETSSFSKAAESCHSTQPTLSNAISQLEDELGGKLFVRTTRKVGMTAFGEYMLPFLTQVLTGKAELEKAAFSYQNPEHSLLRIGLSPLIDMKLVDQILLPYRQAHPEISIFFKECLLDDLAERMQNEQIDFAIVPQDIDILNLHSTFFYQEPLYYLPREINLTSPEKKQYQIKELSEVPIILTGGGCGLNGSLDKLFKKEDVILSQYAGQALSYRVIEEWASLGIGAGILPRAKISEGNKSALPLLLENENAATFSYQWMWGEHSISNSELSQFIEYLKNTMPSLVKGEKQFAVA